jgi:predicted metal-dependent hydrolase
METVGEHLWRKRSDDMTDAEGPYDPRYLAGIVLFNRGDYFEAHEVWEDLWMDTAGADKKFYQGLIQAAVALCHFSNGNLRGATKLYRSGSDYLKKYPSQHFGMNLDNFGQQMHACFARLFNADSPDSNIELEEELLPEIVLDPPPIAWPDPADYLHEEDE